MSSELIAEQAGERCEPEAHPGTDLTGKVWSGVVRTGRWLLWGCIWVGGFYLLHFAAQFMVVGPWIASRYLFRVSLLDNPAGYLGESQSSDLPAGLKLSVAFSGFHYRDPRRGVDFAIRLEQPQLWCPFTHLVVTPKGRPSRVLLVVWPREQQLLYEYPEMGVSVTVATPAQMAREYTELGFRKVEPAAARPAN